jgi:hypothetical protein
MKILSFFAKIEKKLVMEQGEAFKALLKGLRASECFANSREWCAFRVNVTNFPLDLHTQHTTLVT